MSRVTIRMEPFRELKKCKGLRQLINEAYKILGNPIILYDADWKVLAYAEDAVTDDPLWNNHVNSNSIGRNIEPYINAGFVEIMTSANKVVLLESEQLKYSRIFGKIFDKDNNLLAGVSIVASDKPFDDGDIELTEAICKILSGEILKIPYYQGFAQAKLETYINMLLDKELKELNDRIYVSGFVDIVYKGLKNYLYLAVADVSQCDETYAKLEYYRNLFKRTQPAFKYSIYSNYIVVIMSTDTVPMHQKSTFNRLIGIFENDNIRVGTSSHFENLYNLRRYFNEAVCALEYGISSGEDRKVFMYDDYRYDLIK